MNFLLTKRTFSWKRSAASKGPFDILIMQLASPYALPLVSIYSIRQLLP